MYAMPKRRRAGPARGGDAFGSRAAPDSEMASDESGAKPNMVIQPLVTRKAETASRRYPNVIPRLITLPEYPR